MTCSSCGHESPADARFCMHCGAAVARSCAGCGAELPRQARFCPRCGRAASERAPEVAERSPRDYTPRHLADKILSSKSALEGERKQVSVLFADVQGSLELAEELDPEEWHSILDRFFAVLSAGVHRFEGTVNQYTGDGIMALFGAPIAHEDHAHRACYAALHLRDAVREYANEVRVRHGVAFGVRIGLNSGEVVVGKIGDDLRMDYTAQGQVVGLAQRMEALADSGRISLSEHTARLVEGYFELQDLGKVRVKGLSEPVGLFELEGVGPFRTRLDRSRARGLSSFVGREDEMRALESALENATAGRARIVGVVADAGVGKSRLCSEFLERCRAREITVLEAHCPAHGRSIPLLPVLELLRNYFGISESDAPRAAREKIAGRLLLLDRELESSLPLLWDLLRVPDPERPVEDLDAEVRQRRLAEVVRRVVRIRSEREPAVILIDDLHWIDSASDAFVADLVEAVRGTRSLLLVNFRPEYRAEWMQRSDYQQLPLAALGSEAIRALLASLLGSHPSVVELPAVIEARTAGNPFFTEEVVQSLIESGHLEGERGAYRLVNPVERIEIPDTVQAVLAARIDRLVELQKRVLQTAAVIDKNFARPLLAQIAELPEADLDSALRTLCDADFLYERSLYPVPEYTFKHPLTHEVAYLSQLSERRRSLHAALARVLEGPDADASLLAHHWDEAGEAEPAVRWHRRAAEKLGFLSQFETLRHWNRVSQLLEALPESPENLSLGAVARAQILWMQIRVGIEPERAEALFREASELAGRAGDRACLARAQLSYASYLLYSGQGGGPRLAREAVREADASEETRVRIAARWGAAMALYFSAGLEAALELCNEGIELCGGDLDRGSELIGYSPWLFLHGTRAGILAVSGRPMQGLRDLDRSLADHGEKHQLVQAICSGFGVVVHQVTGDSRAALAFGRRAEEGYQRFPVGGAGLVYCYQSLGAALTLNGEWEEALECLERALSESRALRTFVQQQPEMLSWKARALLGRGDPQAALEAVDEAIALGKRLEAGWPRARPHLTRAQILQRVEPGSLERVAAELDAAAACVLEGGARGLLPSVHEGRAELCALRGDDAGRRRELEEALRLCREMGAEPHAARLARALE